MRDLVLILSTVIRIPNFLIEHWSQKSLKGRASKIRSRIRIRPLNILVQESLRRKGISSNKQNGMKWE